MERKIYMAAKKEKKREPASRKSINIYMHKLFPFLTMSGTTVCYKIQLLHCSYCR